MLKEFRDFIARGNVLELAVAVIIGAAFGKIIDSLVADDYGRSVIREQVEMGVAVRMAVLDVLTRGLRGAN